MEDLENKPEVRCIEVKNKIKALDLLDPEVKDRILKRLSEPTYKSILRTEDDKWFPLELFLELLNCIAAEIGEQGIYDWNLKAFEYSVNSSILGTYMRTAVNLFNIHPASLSKLAPYIWKHLYRNCGEMSVEKEGETQIVFTVTDLPPIILGCQAHLLCTGAAFVCLFTLANVPAQVKIEKPKDTSSAVFAISWNPNK